MDDLLTDEQEQHARDLCECPAGCVFLLLAEEIALTPAEAVQPPLSLHLAARSLKIVNTVGYKHDEISIFALKQGNRLLNFAREIMAEQLTKSWFAPIDGAAQILLLRPGGWAIPPHDLPAPTTPIDEWDRAAQKPARSIYTSTWIGDTCSIMAAMEELAGDFYPDLPLRRFLMPVLPDARVYEVDGPLAWSNFVERYPTVDEDDGRLVPDWGLAAREWDAVHLSFGGLLTAEQVVVQGPSGWSAHRTWDAEQSVWLRWCFDVPEELPLVDVLPVSPIELATPVIIRREVW